MKQYIMHSIIKIAGMLVIAAMMGTACSDVNPEETDPQDNKGKNEVKPTPAMYDYPLPEAVDLGLSVKWASMNLFSSEPVSVKGFLPWGAYYNTSCSWRDYRLCEGSEKSLTRYNSDKAYGKVDNKKEFKEYNYEDDAARAYLGGKWRIPTEAEWKELIDNCTWKWKYTSIPDTSKPGTTTTVGGYQVTSKINGASIILPAAGKKKYNSDKFTAEFLYQGQLGFYWTSTASSGANARMFHFSGYGEMTLRYTLRCEGLSIRPVTD